MLVVHEKLGSQDALPIALLKQIARRFRGAPKGVFRVRLLPSLELVASFLEVEFVEKVKAGIEFRCPEVVSRSLPGVCQRGLNINQRSARQQTNNRTAQQRPFCSTRRYTRRFHGKDRSRIIQLVSNSVGGPLRRLRPYWTCWFQIPQSPTA